MLVECGYVRATASDGQEWTFCPSLARIASLGHPREIVELYATLHGPRAAAAATYILICLCEQDDTTPLLGWHDGPAGTMPGAERIIIARHLMHHGIIGRARPDAGDGTYRAEFNAAEYIAAARVHLALSTADAEALSMTELQGLLDAKHPPPPPPPTREEYDEALAAVEARRG